MDVWGINTGRGSAEGRNQEPAALAVKIQHEISSFVDTLNWWIEDGMKESPETVEHYFRSVTGLGNLFSEKD